MKDELSENENLLFYNFINSPEADCRDFFSEQNSRPKTRNILSRQEIRERQT